MDNQNLVQIRQEIAKLRDSAVSASTIKTQMEEQIKNETLQICNLLPDYDGKSAVEAAAKALSDSISAETMEAFRTELDAFMRAVDEKNAKDIEEMTALVEKWKAEIAGDNND